MVMRTKGGPHDHAEDNIRAKIQVILAGRPAMVGSGAALADKPDRAETQGRPADHQRHHSRFALRLPMAGLSAGIRAFHNGVQPLPSLGEAGYVGRDIPRSELCRRHTLREQHRLHNRQGAPLGER